MDALWRSVQPLDYHNQFLAKGVRPDGRRLLKARRFEACTTAITSVDGSARVRIGNTVVLAAIQCEPTPPADTEPSRGRIIVSLELPGVCSPAAAAASRGGAGRLEREQAALVELLQRTATGGLVDLDDLCAVEGRAVWTCYCDMYVLEHDGNLTDAAILAMSTAFGRLCLPRVRYDDALESLVVDEIPPVPSPPLQLVDSKPAKSSKRKRPEVPATQAVADGAATDASSSRGLRSIKLERPLLPSSFGIISGHLMLDVNSEEEGLLSCAFTVFVDANGQFCGVHKPGGAPLPPEFLERATLVATERAPSLLALLNS